MSDTTNILRDKQGRAMNYLRLAITDKCNLRCSYCMPEEGITFAPRKDLMSYEEILRLIVLLSEHGVNKIRITGGEPFLRKDLIHFLKELKGIRKIEKIAITTNGTITARHLDELWELDIRDINLSIDSVDRQRFMKITRRDQCDQVWDCYTQMRDRGFRLKINAVVMKNLNVDDIIPLVALTKQEDVSVRFIEEMPFNGSDENKIGLEWNYLKILEHITEEYGTPKKLKDPKNSTSLNYQIPGHKGSFGIIPAYTRSFCGSCNRLRLTPQGVLKTCLYDEGVFSIRDLMRSGATDDELMAAIQDALAHRAKDGWEAERSRVQNIVESMANIGG